MSETLVHSPIFPVLSAAQIERLHESTLHILEKTGVAVDSERALKLLADAGADTSDRNRVKIPARLVEKALGASPKTITLYNREGEQAFVLDGRSGPHFGVHTDIDDYLDPYTGQRRQCLVEDIEDMARLIDALPNIAWARTSTGHTPAPPDLSDKISLLRCLLNCSKPVISVSNNVDSLRQMIGVCTLIAGGERDLQDKPFFVASNEPISPLFHGREAVEKSLLCAENNIPNVVYSMPMAGATSPATFAGCLCVANAEVLSHLVIVQLLKPGAPVIYGSMPNIMDMRTVYPYGAPELSLMVGALTVLSHHYGLPMFGTGGCTDARVVGAQAASELACSILASTVTKADLVHDVGLMHHATMLSPELAVLADELIGMTGVIAGGIEITDETLALELIDRLGPRAGYLLEHHTLTHFRDFWVPQVFDRTMTDEAGSQHCEGMLKQRTLRILNTHTPKELAPELVRELNTVERVWYAQTEERT